MTAARIEHLRHGLIADYSDTPHPTKVYGFAARQKLTIDEPRSTAYGFVAGPGPVSFVVDGEYLEVKVGQFFCLPSARRITVGPEGGMGFLALRLGYMGIRLVGGPVEDVGRLRYIDGCSDTLLVSPPVKGDPCFNLLHFPVGITQTKHTHPTVRAGMIHRGVGRCITEEGESPLLPGHVFLLAPDAVHAFLTDAHPRGMTLTVYHPDSDFGPTHEDHPMLNRTIVGGVSAKGIDAIRTKEIRA